MSTGSPTPSLESINTPLGSCLDSDPSRSLENSPPVSTTSSVAGNSASTVCPNCGDVYHQPRVLSCLHSICLRCAESNFTLDGIACPVCNTFTNKSPTLLNPDFAVHRLLEACPSDLNTCGGCKIRDTLIGKCLGCKACLCQTCFLTHGYSGVEHTVRTFQELASRDEREICCTRHPTEILNMYCNTCNVIMCSDCQIFEHPVSCHQAINLVGQNKSGMYEQLVANVNAGKSKARDMKVWVSGVETYSNRITEQYQKARADVDLCYKLQIEALNSRKTELDIELSTLYKDKTYTLSQYAERAQNIIEHLNYTCDFADKVRNYCTINEALVHKKTIENKLQEQLSKNCDAGLQSVSVDFEFVASVSKQSFSKYCLGYLRTSPDSSQNKLAPIARPNNVNSMNSLNNCLSNLSVSNNMGLNMSNQSQLAALASQLQQQQQQTNLQNSSINGLSNSLSGLGNNMINNVSLPNSTNPSMKDFINVAQSLTAAKRLPMSQSLFSNGSALAMQDLNLNSSSYDQKWSSGDGFNTDSLSLGMGAADSLSNESSKYIGLNSYPPRSQIKRQKMIYHCKFGEFGVLESQFTEPSGVAVNAQNDIIVADTNNHRIQIFDKEGRFKFQFGECGKRDGQLLYPNRVAVVKNSGDIIVTERSPTHQIQIYNQYGQFVRKFGASTLCYPRGVTVDNKGRIIVIECKVMRVIIFDLFGNVGHQFNCPNYLEFPNGVVVNDRQEIFISDNRAHCVKVFSYEGQYLRQIGGEGLTNYPIGVGITSTGEVLIADNHNNFNLTLFTQEGNLVSAYESKVKHAQCFDVALMDDGSVVLASKDYRLYVYRYLQVAAPHV